MVTVRLPDRLEPDEKNAERVRAELEELGFEVPIYAGPTALETRVSVQIYCDHDDIEGLAEAVSRLR
jgi:hypothetical protein